jgi:hypothetical protein
MTTEPKAPVLIPLTGAVAAIAATAAVVVDRGEVLAEGLRGRPHECAIARDTAVRDQGRAIAERLIGDGRRVGGSHVVRLRSLIVAPFSLGLDGFHSCVETVGAASTPG